MDELGKVKRVIERQAPVGEVLLVLDATTGQNGLTAGSDLRRGGRCDWALCSPSWTARPRAASWFRYSANLASR